jgi:CubicO group peptidase (beta-lactamase class C family)
VTTPHDCLAGWPTQTPLEVGLDPEGVDRLFAAVDGFCPVKGARSTVLIRDGGLVRAGDEAGATYNLFSVTKTVACTLALILVRDGRLDLDRPAADLVPVLHGLYPALTPRHLLTMTSGYDARGGRYGVPVDGPDHEPGRPVLDGGGLSDGSLTPLDPADPLFEPGTMFHYHDDGQRLLGAVVRAVAGEPLEVLFEREVAGVIGMRGWWWDQYLSNGLGADAASGFFTNALELAKFGQFWLEGGRGLLPAELVRTATSPRSAHLPHYRGPRFRGLAVGGVFGMAWRSNVSGHFAHLPADAFWASGWNHIKLFVVPSQRLVVARLGFDGAVPDDDAKWDGAFAELGVVPRREACTS